MWHLHFLWATYCGFTSLKVKNLFLISHLNLPKDVLNSPQREFIVQSVQYQCSQTDFLWEVLQPPDHLCDLPLDSLRQLHVLLMLRAPEQNAAPQAVFHERKGEDPSLAELATMLLMQPKTGLAQQHLILAEIFDSKANCNRIREVPGALKTGKLLLL